MTLSLITLDLQGVNCYLYAHQGKFILIDTGGPLTLDKEYNDRRQLLEEKLIQQGCNADNVTLILLTHGDMDHSWNALYFSKLFHAPIALHPDDIPLVDHPKLDVVAQSFQYHSLIFRIVFSLLKGKILKKTAKFLTKFDSFIPEILLSDHSNLTDYGFHGTIVPLPGHTPGSIGLLLENGDFICGDTFTYHKKPVLGFNAFNYRQMKRSANSLKDVPIQKVYPGHGPSFTHLPI